MQRLYCAECPSAFRNRCVFSPFLKLSALSDGSRRSSGSAFQAIGLATENARRPSVLWYDEMVAAGRSKSLTTGNIRCGVAAVHGVLGSPALETPVNCHSELLESLASGMDPVSELLPCAIKVSLLHPGVRNNGVLTVERPHSW